MPNATPSIQEVRRILGQYSIAPISNWLKRRKLSHTMNTRDEMVARVHGLLQKGELKENDLIGAAIGIEESSSKRTFLYSIPHTSTDLSRINNQLDELKVPLSKARILSSSPTITPKLVYAMNDESVLRAKWNEQHVRVTVDKVHRQFNETKIPKIIVLIVDKKAGKVQLRYDKPDDRHSHVVDHEPSDDAYFKDYLEKAENMLGLPMTPIDFRPGLERVLKLEPRVVRTNYTVDDAEDGALTKRTQKQAGKDIRDTAEWKRIASDSGVRTFEEAPLRWLPEMSEGKVNRELFSYVDAANGFVRFDADCYEDEIDYVLHQLVQE